MKSRGVFMAVAVVAAMVATSVFGAQKYEPKERPTQELCARAGLPNFYKKLNDGKSVNIVYFGGSITAQPGWRVQTENYFKKRFPKAKITAINSAIGGTGSDLGVFRTDRDVIAHSPDLVFVEFAVNDSSAAPDNIVKSMEGIVRKIKTANKNTDICFVYTFTEKQLSTLEEGKMFRSELAMEDVADHYAIPSINMALELAKLHKDGKLTMAAAGGKMTAVSGDTLDAEASMTRDKDGKIVFSKDGVHPYPNTGHVFYTKALTRSFEKIEKMRAKPTKLPAPIAADNFENAKNVRADDPVFSYSGDFSKDGVKSPNMAGFSRNIDTVVDMRQNSSMKFSFKGDTLGVLSVIGPHGGEVEIYVDGKKTKSIKMIDGYCTYKRVSKAALAGGLSDKFHDIEIRVSENKFDKRNILFPNNRKFFDAKKNQFASYEFSPAAILFTGEIQKARQSTNK